MGELWIKTCITNLFPVQHLCILTLITRKLQVIYGRTYRMTGLLLEISIFCVRAEYTNRLASYGSKHSLQFLFNKPFVHPYTHSLKTTGYVWTFSILSDYFTIGDIGHSLMQNCMHILQVCIYIAIWCATMHDTKTHIPYDCILHTK